MSRTHKSYPTLVTWRITDEMLSDWEYLDKEVPRNQTYGCVYNTLAFIRVIPRDVAEYLTKLSNQRIIKSGTTPEEFFELMHEYYNDRFDTKNRFELIAKDLSPETWDEMYQHIPNHSGTFLWLQRGGNMPGHAVVLAKYDDEFIIIDPQQGKIRKYEDFDKWFTRQGIESMLFVIKHKTAKRNYNQTKRMFQRTPSREKPQTKRRRVSQTLTPDQYSPTSRSRPPSKRRSIYQYRSPVRTPSRTPSNHDSRTRSKPDLRQSTPSRSRTANIRSKTPALRFNLESCRDGNRNTPLKKNEICVPILSHGSYIDMDLESADLVESFDPNNNPLYVNIPFSKFPLRNDHPGIYNTDTPASKTFKTPANVVLYQYSHPETHLLGLQVDYIQSNLGSGKCIVSDLPDTYAIYAKPPSQSNSKKNKPDMKVLVRKANAYTTLPNTNTSNLMLGFDHSIPSYQMGYGVISNNGIEENVNLSLTYTSLRNMLYDLSARYPDKKIYVHQLSCREGDYSDYKQNLLDLKYLTNIYAEHRSQNDAEWSQYVLDFIGSIEEKIRSTTNDEIEMQLDELTRDFEKINIEDRAFDTYTDEKVKSLLSQNYKYVTTILATEFSDNVYHPSTGRK